MSSFTRGLLTNWHFGRVLQLMFGVAALSYGIYLQDTMYNIVGAVFLGQAVFNISLCGATGCGNSSQKRYSGPTVKVEEYKPKR